MAIDLTPRPRPAPASSSRPPISSGQRYPPQVVREIEDGDLGYSPEGWREMAGLGWLGITFPEAFGGTGGGIPRPLPHLRGDGAVHRPEPAPRHGRDRGRRDPHRRHRRPASDVAPRDRRTASASSALRPSNRTARSGRGGIIELRTTARRRVRGERDEVARTVRAVGGLLPVSGPHGRRRGAGRHLRAARRRPCRRRHVRADPEHRRQRAVRGALRRRVDADRKRRRRRSTAAGGRCPTRRPRRRSCRPPPSSARPERSST